MIGPLVPVPVPQVVLDALDRACTVTTNDAGTSGFQLTFTLSNRSPLHTLFLLTGRQSDPIRARRHRRHRQRHAGRADGRRDDQSPDSPGADSGHSTLTITGEDLTVLMD